MRKTTALWNFTLLASLLVSTSVVQAAVRSQNLEGRTFAHQLNAPPQAAQAKNWKSTDEYNAFNAMAKETDPNKKIALADAFLQKFSNTDFKDLVYQQELQAYQQLNQPDKAIEAAHKTLEANPDSLDALRYLSFVFPFVFNPTPPQWQAAHAYSSLGAVIQAAAAGGAHVQILTKGGTSGPTAPPFSATGDTVCENGGSAPCWRDGGLSDQYVAGQLSRAESDAKHALELLQKLQKPAGVADDQFNQAVKGLRAVFNGTVGFVALQRKDYAGAITSYKAASEDNPSDWYVFYRMGLAYLYSNPPDHDHAIWYIARAFDLAQAAKDSNAAEFEKYLKQVYVNHHGNEEGLKDIETQAASSVNPPDGFKVAAMEAPKKTGDALVDQFNEMTYPLKLGGEMAQKQWDGLKGQPLEFGGVVDSVEKGTEAGTYLVRIDILEQSKATAGVYDIELKDSKQPNVKNLVHGDVIRFKGVMDSYTPTPNLVLTVVGEVTLPDPLPDKPPVKEKPKPAPTTHRRPAQHKTTQ